MSKQLVVDMRLSPLILFFIVTLLFAGCSSITPRSSGPPGVAVWELEDLTAEGQLAHVGELLAAQITDTLGKQGKYVVVERSRLIRILEEQQLSASSLADRQTQLRLGELIGARFMVFGGYQMLGDKVRIDIRLVDVETGRISKAVKKVVTSTDMQTLLDAAQSAATEL
ncbi:MAG: FlgO family outer membrane protein [Desulfuromonadaceae bacterium]|nr:FlgO family outer membrane protein [Desulfuromonadaceae bacterium]